jgi:hypothetical protein
MTNNMREAHVKGQGKIFDIEGEIAIYIDTVK